MNFDNLKSMTVEQLHNIARSQGLRTHHRAKPETIIKQIMDAALNPQKPEVNTHVAEQPKAPVDHNTPDTIEAAVAEIKARRPEFETKYNLEENTWKFSCKGAEESGNMAIPLRIIKQKAEYVAKGRRVLQGLPDFDRIHSPNPQSAYTNAVLAG